MSRLACDGQRRTHSFGPLSHHAQAIVTGRGSFRIKTLSIIPYRQFNRVLSVLEEDLHLRAWNDAEFVGHVETLYATLWVYAML